jgi:hypothetical protein
MSSNSFTSTDYSMAVKERINDIKLLSTRDTSIILNAYVAGVAVECFLRSFTADDPDRFEPRHDLFLWLTNSKILVDMKKAERERTTIAIKSINNKWNNNLRYGSELRMRRLLGHEIAKNNPKKLNKFLKKYYSDVFVNAEKILAIGEKNGTN